MKDRIEAKLELRNAQIVSEQRRSQILASRLRDLYERLEDKGLMFTLSGSQREFWRLKRDISWTEGNPENIA